MPAVVEETQSTISTDSRVPIARFSDQNSNSLTKDVKKHATKPKDYRPKRPNYAQIHSQPLPVKTYPLPVLIPQHPFSLLQIAYSVLSQLLWPPTSHPTVHQGHFSPETQSVHVVDIKSIRALWEQGFFGKGTLSRSEPRWLDQEKRRRGIIALETSEEVTRKRREERRQFKLERARKEREAIEQQLREEGKLLNPANASEFTMEAQDSEGERDVLLPAYENARGRADRSASHTTLTDIANMAEDELQQEVEDEEHLQLTPEEAFFLSYTLGVLQITHDNTTLLHSAIFSLFATPRTLSTPTQTIEPDNPFLLKYVVYHHFRSIGWVIRPGVKFAVDYLLYNRGPVFSHAEFAVMILPSYSHRYWSETEERKQRKGSMEKRDWWWLHRINRVQTQVHKTLVLVYVDVPPPKYVRRDELADIGATLKRYRIRELILRRWTPNRNRD